MKFSVEIKGEDLDKIRDFFEKWVDDYEFRNPSGLIRDLFYLYDDRRGYCLDLREDVKVEILDAGASTFKIVRNYFRTYKKRTIKRGLSLAEAQAHCHSPETSSNTCTSAEGKRRTRRVGPWFDSYTRE